MPIPILGARQARRQAEHDTRIRAERTELIAKTVAAVVPPANRKGQTVDVDQLVRQITTSLNPSVAVVPEEIQAALEAQGMNWQGQFAPGRPLQPFAGYGVTPRGFNYTPGRNVSTQPRSDRIPFATLKQIIDGYDVAQICIQHIINDLCSMPLLFQPMEGVDEDVSDEITAAKAFLRKPDGKRPFRRWLSMWFQDVLRYDAGCLFKQPDRAGRLKALKVIEGPTISPLVDYWGDIPDAPAPAYLQFVEGMPWDWMDETQLIYQPFTPLRESPYGLAPIEAVLLNANTDVRFQWYFMQYFTDGTVPATWMEAPPDMSDPDSLAEWQETWDAWLMGDQAKKHQVRWVPAGSKPTPAKDTTFQADFPEYLMRRTVAAFMLVPHDLGFTDDVNRATGDTQIDVQFRISTQPRTGYVEDILDDVLQHDLGLRVQVRFDDGREKEDRLQEAQAHQIYVSIGAESADEVRSDVLGKPVNPEEMTPRIFDSQRLGPIPLSYIIATAGQIDMETGAPLPGSVEPRQFVVPGAIAPDPGASQPDDGTALTGGEQTDPGDMHAGQPDGKTIDGAPVTDPVVKAALRRWRDNSRSRVRRGQPPRMFADTDLPDELAGPVWQLLSKAGSREQVDTIFERLLKAGEPDPKGDARPGPGGHREADLVNYWSDRLAADLEAQIDGQQIADGFVATSPPHISGTTPTADAGQAAAAGGDALTAAARSYAQSIHLDQTKLTATLKGLYRDAWLAGAKDGADQLSVLPAPAGAEPAAVPETDSLAQAVIGTDWDHWNPGHPMAADRIADGGLDRMLQQAGVTIAGINDTTRDRIADALEAGVRNGDTVERIAAEIDKVRNNPARSRLIAVTEVNRAMTQASIDSYRSAGLAAFNLLTSPGACPVCESIAADNPHPLDDLDAQPPVHPRCRCAAQPVVD